MISVQGLIVLAIVAWYSLVIMKSTNNYYKDAYRKHLEQEAQKYHQGLAKEINIKKEQQVEAALKKGELIRDEEHCFEDDDVDVCSSNSKEALIYEKMYKNYP